ncbi:hypothetical protein ACSBR2_023659 [Camellia fascicularis]
MTKMENESNLEVTFSKRRSGLLKKASELSILCGAEALLDVEKQHGTALDQLMMAAGQGEHRWWEGPVEEMNLPQLHQYEAAMMELRTKVGIRADRIVHE